MTEFRKNREIDKEIINNYPREQLVLNSGELGVNSTISDDNTICTRETESSILTILKSSKKDYIFDDRIKLYNKDKNWKRQKDNKMKENNSTKEFNCCMPNYKLFKNMILVIGIIFFLFSVVGILFLILLPKITEHYVKKSNFGIREIDILQISRYNGDTSFEVNAVLDIKNISKYKTQFIHSLLNISYQIISEGNDKNLLGELYISQMSENNEGEISARGRFTIKNKESMKILLKNITSILVNFQERDDLKHEIVFYGKGLISLKVFGIVLNNINVEKTLNSFSIYDIFKKSKRDVNEEMNLNDYSQNSDSINYNGIKIHNKWFNTYDEKGVRINFEVEIDLKNIFNYNSGGEVVIPKLAMGNIGNLKFNVLFENEKICEVTWFDVNFNSGNNIWSISIDFPSVIPDKLKELIVNILFHEKDFSKRYIIIKGNLAENEAFNDVFKNLEIKIPLINILNLIESEIKGFKFSNSKMDIFKKLIRFIRLYDIDLLKDTEDITVVGHVKVGYINPLGDNLPIIFNNLKLKSIITDQLNYNYGVMTLKLVKKEKYLGLKTRKLYGSDYDNNAIINLFENTGNQMLSQRRVPRMSSKYTNFEEVQNSKNYNLNKCSNKNINDLNQPIALNPCYNIEEFDMELSVNTDIVDPKVKNGWFQNMIDNNRNLILSESKISANVTSIFGNSFFKEIKINRNLLEDKNKIKLLNSYEEELDEDDYNFEDYYKDESNTKDENLKTFDVKNHTNLININEIKILGEGYNNSWITKIKINKTEILGNLGLNHLEIGSFGVLLSFENSSFGFLGAENFKIEPKSDLLLFGVIKPENEPGTNEINHSVTKFIKSIITGNQTEIQNKNFTLEFKTGNEGKEKCIQYFNYSNYISEKEINLWLNNEQLPKNDILDKTVSKKKNWLEKLLNGQRIDIPATMLKQLALFDIQKFLDKTIENNSVLIRNSLCKVQSIFNEEIVFENDVNFNRNKIKEILTSKLKERNIELSNIIFQVVMAKRENDLIIPIQGMFDLSVPNIISKQIFIDILFINYKLEIYDKDHQKRILEFEHLQHFNDLNVESNENLLKQKKIDKLDLSFHFENSILKLEDESDQLMNTLKSIFAIPKFSNEQVNRIEIKSSIGVAIQSSLGIFKLNDVDLFSTIEIPKCDRKIINNSENKTNINSIFKVESIQIQKIRLILPPRGIDIQINTTINLPNYIDDMKLDIIIGQCVFELKNQENNLLAIVKTPKQIIIGNNRRTESVCHGFVPAKSWLPMMNLLANEEKKDEKLHIKAINTPHGIPYWLLPIFDYYKLPVSNTLSSLDATEFGSVTFS